VPFRSTASGFSAFWQPARPESNNECDFSFKVSRYQFPHEEVGKTLNGKPETGNLRMLSPSLLQRDQQSWIAMQAGY
jgi:hypothetical protein